MKKVILTFILMLVIIIPGIIFLVQLFKKMPDNISYKSEIKNGDFEFLYDLTYKDVEGSKKSEQEIFSNVYKLIDDAKEFLVLDFFLYNDDYNKEKYSFPTLSKNLTDKLILKKAQTNIDIVLITDPINTFYGSYNTEQIKRLQDAGIEVVISNLMEIKDANPIYSNLYRAYFKYIPMNKKGSLKNVFRPQGDKVSIKAYLDLLNFKANHRKVAINEKEAIITSANPHDGSALHSNIAVKVKGEIVEDILKTEQAVVRLSDKDSKINKFKVNASDNGNFKMQVVTEGKIKEALLDTIKGAKKDEQIYIGVFYLGERNVVNAIKQAAKRGVKVHIVLDLNKDAFGQEKIGIPNKPVAYELAKNENIKIRWYETQGEQFHSKMLFYQGENKDTLIAGSANFTRRNLNDLNLETDMVISGDKNSKQMQSVSTYIDRIWNNKGGTYTADYEKYKEDSWWKIIVYFIQEITGLSTF